MRYGFLVTRSTLSTLRPRARDMRLAPTRTEARLWEALRTTRLGVRFRRQVVLGPYIVDFFAPSARLVVEVDGPVHLAHRAYDEQRDRVLAAHGLRVVRVESARVEHDLPGVLDELRRSLR